MKLSENVTPWVHTRNLTYVDGAKRLYFPYELFCFQCLFPGLAPVTTAFVWSSGAGRAGDSEASPSPRVSTNHAGQGHLLTTRPCLRVAGVA